MPKLTFFNLPDHKRKTLIEAAEKEFTRVPLFEASIANIIKMANIPRGSFYQYFEDKEDLYFYLLDNKLKESKEVFIMLIKKHNGDIIEAAMEMYYRFLVEIPDEEERNFLKNAFLYATYKVEKSFMNIFNFMGDPVCSNEIIDLIDKQKFNLKENEEFFDLLQIIRAVALQNFIEKISKKMSDDEAIKQFKCKIDLIKYGAYKS